MEKNCQANAQEDLYFSQKFPVDTNTLLIWVCNNSEDEDIPAQASIYNPATDYLLYIRGGGRYGKSATQKDLLGSHG